MKNNLIIKKRKGLGLVEFVLTSILIMFVLVYILSKEVEKYNELILEKTFTELEFIVNRTIDSIDGTFVGFLKEDDNGKCLNYNFNNLSDIAPIVNLSTLEECIYNESTTKRMYFDNIDNSGYYNFTSFPMRFKYEKGSTNFEFKIIIENKDDSDYMIKNKDLFFNKIKDWMYTKEPFVLFKTINVIESGSISSTPGSYKITITITI